MKLHCFPLSPRSRKCMAVALHLELPVEFHIVDLANGEQKTPEFLKLNPNGRVPVLEEGGFVLWESNAILSYLADKKPGQLAPPPEAAHEQSRALIAQWLAWDVADWDKAWAVLMFEHIVKRFRNLAVDPTKVAEGNEKVAHACTLLDAHFAEREYTCGKDLSIADFALAAQLDLAAPCGVDLGEYHNIQKWHARIATLQAWQATAPQT